MGKISAVIVVVVMVIAVYLLMLVVMPVVVDMSLTANSTMNATSNMSLYPGTSGAMVSAPWVLWFVPGVIGMIAVVVILKRP